MESGQYWDLLARGFIKPEDQEPEIYGLDFYFDAFAELATCRPGGMDVQPIPFTAIIEYARIYEVGDFEEFKEIIRMMDDTLLKLQKESEKKQSGGTKNAAKRKPNKTHKN